MKFFQRCNLAWKLIAAIEVSCLIKEVDKTVGWSRWLGMEITRKVDKFESGIGKSVPFERVERRFVIPSPENASGRWSMLRAPTAQHPGAPSAGMRSNSFRGGFWHPKPHTIHYMYTRVIVVTLSHWWICFFTRSFGLLFTVRRHKIAEPRLADEFSSRWKQEPGV